MYVWQLGNQGVMVWKWPKYEYFIISLCCVYIYRVRMRVLMSTFNVITERIISVVAFCFLWKCNFFSRLFVFSFSIWTWYFYWPQKCVEINFLATFFSFAGCNILFYYFQCYFYFLLYRVIIWKWCWHAEPGTLGFMIIATSLKSRLLTHFRFHWNVMDFAATIAHIISYHRRYLLVISYVRFPWKIRQIRLLFLPLHFICDERFG